MPHGPPIPIASKASPGRFAARLGSFYGALFGLIGTHLLFFPVWLKAIGIDAGWIGIIAAVPAVTRFTVLPIVTGLAERGQGLRDALVATSFVTALGFTLVGTQHAPLAVFLAYALTACLWTPMVPLTDAYALRGVARYSLAYGPLRLWGSAAFVIGALTCGVLVDVIAARHLIWIIAAAAVRTAAVSLRRCPLEQPKAAATAPPGGRVLLREPNFLVIIVAAALIQGSHAAYYTFASITWQAFGLDGLTIAALWVLGVLAEIAVFALSPRLTLQPSVLMVIGGSCAVLRWLITAQEPSVAVLAVVQLTHGLTYGLTQVGTMGLLVRQVPIDFMARGQGYFAACSGIVASAASIVSGAIYAKYGQGVYYAMAAMALSGAVLMWLARDQLSVQPHSAASGG